MKTRIAAICLILIALLLFSGCGVYCCFGGGKSSNLEADLQYLKRASNRLEDNQIRILEKLEAEEDPC